MNTALPASTIVTVTLNPALDEAISLERLGVGETNRCRLETLDPGGKGINASRVISRLGFTTLALGFVGGVTGAIVRARLDGEGVPHAFDDLEEMTRLNVMVYESAAARRTRLLLAGASVAPEQIDRLRRRLEAVAPGGVVVLGGSVPPGLSVTVYADLVSWLRERGVRTIVDTSGAALAAVLSARPTLVKPNVEEAAELLGHPLRNDDEIMVAATEIRRRGPEYVVVSQGADGAIGLGQDGARKAMPSRVVSLSAVGSGDSMVAGMAIALATGRDFDEVLRLGTAAGAATALAPGTQLCNPADVERLLPRVSLRALETVALS